VRARLDARARTLGWHLVEDAFAGLHAVADGVMIRPHLQDLTADFVLPAGARDICLVSETSVPAHVVSGAGDDRRLGDGFHAISDGARWTDGSAALPAVLWAGCKGSFFLRVTLAGLALPRWVAPGDAAGVVSLAERRQT